MMNRSLLIIALASIWVSARAQQTPPVQPKTVDIPKLVPLVPPSLPQGKEMIPNAPLTASEAVAIAISHQPQVTIAKAAADASHGVTLQTQSQLNPTVIVGATATKSQTFQSGNGNTLATNSQLGANITLNQLIFDFDRTRDAVRQSQALENAQYRTYDQTLQDVALTAKQDFYAYVQAKQETKVQEANVKSRQAQLDLTQATVNAGTGEPLDLVSAKTFAAQAVLAWSQAQQAESVARVKLATDLGIDPRTPIEVADSSESRVTLPEDTNSLIDLALKQRPNILSSIQSLRAAGYGVSVARKSQVPSLNFSAGYDGSGANNPIDAQTGYISLTLNWNLIDGGLRLGKVREAEANKSSAAAMLRQTSQTVIQDVTNAVVGLQAARQQIPIAQSEVANAEEGVRLATGRYKAGVTTFQEVITAQAALVTAQTDHVNSVEGLATALATLDHAIGKWPVN